MTTVFVQYSQMCTYNHQSTEQYGSWGTRYDSSVEGIVLDRYHRYYLEEFSVAPQFVPGDIAYVLWMTYGTGDSFGSSSGEIEVLWVFKDFDVASAARDQIEKQIKQDAYSLTFRDEEGIDRCLSNPCWDYFSGLEDLYLSEFLVDDCPESHYQEEDME